MTALAERLKDEDAIVRARSVRALGMIGPAAKEAAPAIAEALKDEDADVREAAREALAALGGASD